MKNLSLALAIVMLSGMCYSPLGVFAAGADTEIEYYDGSAFPADITIGASKYGLTQAAGVTDAPQTDTNDKAFHFYGKALASLASTSFFECRFKTVAPTVQTSKKQYTISFDFYPTKPMSFALRGGVGSGTRQYADFNFYTQGIDKPSVEVGTGTFNALADYPIELDRWSRITITIEPIVYQNPEATTAEFFYECFINGKRIGARGQKITDAKFPDPYHLLLGNFSPLLIEGKSYDFYLDNYRTAARDANFTGAIPAIETIAPLMGTLDEEDKTIQLKNSAVTVSELKADITPVNSTALAVYRGAATVEDGDALQDGDLLCVKGGDGFTYYEVILPSPPPKIDSEITGTLEPNETITATATVTGKVAEEITMIVALYRGITHVETQTVTIAADTYDDDDFEKVINIPDKPGNYSAKVFFWDDITGMNSAARTTTVQQG